MGKIKCLQFINTYNRCSVFTVYQTSNGNWNAFEYCIWTLVGFSLGFRIWASVSLSNKLTFEFSFGRPDTMETANLQYGHDPFPPFSTKTEAGQSEFYMKPLLTSDKLTIKLWMILLLNAQHHIHYSTRSFCMVSCENRNFFEFNGWRMEIEKLRRSKLDIKPSPLYINCIYSL